MRPRSRFCLALALAVVPALAQASVSVSPPSVTLRPTEATPIITVQLVFSPQSLPGTGTLEITPPAALVGSVSLEPNPVTYSWGTAATTATTQFRLRTTAATPPGNYTFVVADDTLDAGSTTFSLRILQPTFSGRVSPATVGLTLGGSPATVTVETLPATGFSQPVRWELTGFPAFVRTGGAQTASAPGYPDVTFGLSLGAGASAGTYSGTVRGTSSGAPGVSLPLTVVVSAPSFTPRVTPPRLTLTAGGPALAITVDTSAPGVESGAVRYSVVGLPSGISGGGSQTTAAPGFPAVRFALSAGREAVIGTFQPRVRGVFEPGGVVREVPFTLVVERVLPQITGVLPSRVAAGALGQRLQVLGRDFEAGARIESTTPGVRLGATSFLSSERLEATLDVRGDVPGGTLRLDVVNPGGERSPSSGIVPVVAAGALAGSVTVETVAVVYPAPGATIASGEHLQPRGVLGVSGSGPLVVSWRLDGVPFDRLVVLARGGEPVAVAGRAPIPQTSLGQHLLELVVEGSREVASRPVALLQVGAREARLRFLSPEDGRAVQSEWPPLLTWTQVPGALGYRVEVLDAAGVAVAEWPAGSARWRAPAAGLARLAGGGYQWQVRPVFAGGVLGTPLEPRRFTLLPASVDLVSSVERADGALVVRWRGGALGALYRVECVDAAGRVLFSALTGGDHYRLPAALTEPAGAWRVLAVAPDGSVLGTSAPSDLPQAGLGPPPDYRLAASSEVTLTVQSPSAGSFVESSQPELQAAWDNAVDPQEVLLLVDATDVTSLAKVDPQSIAYTPFLPLEAGPHHVSLRVGEQVFEWEFETAWSEVGGAGEAGGWSDGSAGGSWQVDFEVTGTWTDGDELPTGESELYGTLTLTGEERAAERYLQTSADVSARQAVAPGDAFEQQNRSWVVGAGDAQGAWSQDVEVGYMAPAFLFGGELLTAGLPQGGAQVSVGGGPVSVSYYEAIDPDLEGVVTGVSGAAQELRAAALEVASAGGSELRVVGLEVEEAEDAFFGGGDGSLYGLFGRWALAGGSSLVLEVAHGEFTPSPASFESAAEGDAARLAWSRMKDNWSFDLGLRWVEADFINPTNRGLAAGGIPDREGLDLRVGKSWEGGNLDVGLRHFRGGSAAVGASLSGGELSLAQQLGSAVNLTVTAGYSLTDSDADVALGLPASERADWNLALSLSERIGTWTWSQDLARSDSDDRLDPMLASDTSQAGLALQRSGERLQLFGQLTALRSRYGANQETTDTQLATLQPTWSWAASGVSLTPFASYSRVEDDFSLQPTISESYRFTLSWSPPRIAWLSALQLSSEWSRLDGPFALSDDFVARYSASLAIGWGTGRRRAAQSFGADPYAQEPISGALLPAASSLEL